MGTKLQFAEVWPPLLRVSTFCLIICPKLLGVSTLHCYLILTHVLPRAIIHWRNSDYCSLHWNTTGGTVTAQTHPHIVKQCSIHASLKWRSLSIQLFHVFLEFIALRWIPVMLFKRVSTSTLLSACLGNEHHYSFCIFGVSVQIKSAYLKQLSPYQLYIRGCMLGSDLT